MKKANEIEQAAALAEAETGARGGGAKIPLCLKDGAPKKYSYWSKDDDAYVRENHGWVSEANMAAHLGKTETAVHIHINRELHLIAPSKDPSILTGEQVAWGLGIDGKSVHMLMDRGLMSHRLLPDRDKTRVIDRQALMRWLINPMNWVYINPERVGEIRPRGNRSLSDCYDFAFWESARGVVRKVMAEWKDEWLTPGQAADALGVVCTRRKARAHTVNKAILVGNLKAVRWGNWRILRSSLPPKGMTINTLGRIVPKTSIGRKSCSRCGNMGHMKKTCISKIRETKPQKLKI